MESMVMILVNVCCAFLTATLAKKKTRSKVGWIISGLLFGLVALALLVLLPDLTPGSITRTEANMSWKERATRLVCAVFLAFSFGTVAVQMGETLVNGNSQNGMISESQAVTLCRNAFRSGAPYGSDIGILDSYSHKKKGGMHVIRLQGKTQNAFGMMRERQAICKVPIYPLFEGMDWSNSRNVTYFEFI